MLTGIKLIKSSAVNRLDGKRNKRVRKKIVCFLLKLLPIARFYCKMSGPATSYSQVAVTRKTRTTKVLIPSLNEFLLPFVCKMIFNTRPRD